MAYKKVNAANNEEHTELSTNQKIGVSLGLTAAAVAAAGAYFLYGSDKATKNRETVKSWMLKAKAEVLERLEDAKSMSREEYEELIAAVAGTYSGVKSATKKDIRAFSSEMIDHWESLESTFAKKKAPVKRTAKTIAATAAKEALKGAAKGAVKGARKSPAAKAVASKTKSTTKAADKTKKSSSAS